MLPLDQLIKPLTEDEVFDKFVEIAEELKLPAKTWRKGSPLRVILRVCARVYAGFTVIMAAFIASGFLDTAQGEWLTKLAKYVYGVDRRVATFARETIRFTNAGGGLYDDNPPGTVTVINPATQKAYRNVAAFTLNPLSSVDVVFEAVEVGSASSAAPNTLTELETTMNLVTVTNPRAFIGLDAENDDDLKQACKDKLATLANRGGPRGAYRYAIRVATSGDGSPVNINRSSVSNSSSKGEVYVYVASPTGAPLEDEVALVAASVEKYARPDGVRAYVNPVTEVPVTRTLTAWVKNRPGVVASDVKATIEAAIVLEGARYPIGGIAKAPSTQGKLYADWLAGVVKQAWPDVYDVDGTGADVNLAPGEVAVLDVTVNVRLQEAA